MAFTPANCRSGYNYFCQSSDIKPTEGIEINSLFLELDTGDFYYFDGIEWKLVGWNA